MMQEHPLEGTTREKALHTMREQTYRMEGLVKQLLTLSKIEAAPALLLNEKVDVPMMLRVVEHEAHTLSQNNHTFTFDIDSHLSVRGNEEQLRSAISNLVYNAVNHTPRVRTSPCAGSMLPLGRNLASRTMGWYCCGAYSSFDRTLLSRGQSAIPTNGREWTGSGHRETCSATSR